MEMHSSIRKGSLCVASLLTSLLVGCATVEKKPQEVDDLKRQLKEAQTVISLSQIRIDGLEKKITTLEGQIKSADSSSPKAISVVPSVSHPADQTIESPRPTQSKLDPENGFTQDEPIQYYRKALSLKNSGKTPEALTTFSQFVERYPDHPLASHAQFQVGDSHFIQKEYLLAIEQLEKLLKNYDKSARIPEALAELVVSHEALNQKEQAARHRHHLTSIFPQSPAAKPILSATPSSVPTAGNPKP